MKQLADYMSDGVASFTDAWIETPADADQIKSDLSHLLQMRGLKQKARNANY